MELRLDRLLAELRYRPTDILAAIDADPMLLKRTSGDLVLANASTALYTPMEQHQLYAKGIVYCRQPYRLISLPLIKIYNLGERDVELAHLLQLLAEPGVRLRYLRKMDGSLIQVFRYQGQVLFTTRGMIEGAKLRAEDSREKERPDFNYLAEARGLAERLYPQLLREPTLLDGRTLVFELIHPQARVVTNYGDMTDLILLTCFDHRRCIYVGQDELLAIAQAGQLRPVEQLTPFGEGLAEQIESLLASWSGTDEEGAVLSFERTGEIIYRVKVKSPEYLQLMRLLAFCTYDRTVALIDAHPHVKGWPDLEEVLRQQGRDKVPEEVLGYYREHWDRFEEYLADLRSLSEWAEAERARIDTLVGGIGGRTATEYRKAFALQAVTSPGRALLFAALDGRLQLDSLRKMFPRPQQAREFLLQLQTESRFSQRKSGSSSAAT